MNRKNAQHNQNISHIPISCNYKKLSLKTKKCSIKKIEWQKEAIRGYMDFGKRMKVICIQKKWNIKVRCLNQQDFLRVEYKY